jgi:lysophospholipase L1-like esterase
MHGGTDGGGTVRIRFASILSALVAVTLAAMGCLELAATATSAASPPTTYYLALGDSLSTGGGATTGASYVDDLYAAEQKRVPGLVLENLGCAGDSTTRMISGGLCTTYTTGNQLGDAEAFLRAHPGAVKFVTIDVGGDDVDGCVPNGVLNQTCVANGLAKVKTNMQTILGGLRAAGGNVPMVGMSYYDPFLADYLTGTSGQQAAFSSLGVLHSLNSELRSAYKQFDVRIAAVQKLFNSWNTAETGSYEGQTLPQDVANICNWTHMCDPTDATVHTNDTGHALIAVAYDVKVDTLVPSG